MFGNLRTAPYTYLQARHNGGTLQFLRIEDTDQGCLVETLPRYYGTLRYGLTWDEGPDVGGPVRPPTCRASALGMFKQ